MAANVLFSLKAIYRRLVEFAREKRLNYLFYFTVLVATGALLPAKFVVTLTPSTVYRIFYLDRSPEEIGKNDYVLLEISTPHIKDGEPFKAVKRVACVEGDTLQVKKKEYFCNGENLGRAKDFTLKGKRLDHFHFSGRVPEGTLFVTGSHIDSFDSRYFGFVKIKDVEAIAYPLF